MIFAKSTKTTMPPLLLLGLQFSCLLLIGFSSVEAATSKAMMIRLPRKYTAMEKDIEVSFVLDKPNAFQYNAIVHLEYLPADAILSGKEDVDGSHHSKPVKLTSLPVPLGVKEGAVVFMCGAIKYAGPHRAFLTVNGKRMAESQILQVSWPPMTITAPSRLETYSTDVSVTVAFTRSLCTTFTVHGDWGTNSSPFFGSRRSSKLGFETRLELIECSKSLAEPEHQDCQAPTDPGDKRIWASLTMDNLYRKASVALSINCSTWGQSGTFRLFLRTNLSHAAIVARSSAIVVRDNPGYGLKSEEAQFIFPCLENDIKPFSVVRPKCASDRDKVRVYGQGKCANKIKIITLFPFFTRAPFLPRE